ncbi:MAG: DNA repair protein RecN [Lachnospiraceae bacterium]|nr:DNA repair protein RecN [Lachnospiraceae bacterium]
MLRNLHVKNLALIREIDVDFTDGLNILTGETGSGKSIIVDSIGLALGGRAQRDMLRSSGSALAELVFEVTDRETLDALKEHDILDDEGVIVFSRRMQDGRSTMRINGETRTAQEVRECASLLLDIHGQSEHQKLLREETQLELLDEYGGTEIAALKAAVAADYRAWSSIRRELGGEELSAEERAEQISFLEYQISEIEDAALREGEDEEVEKTYRRLLHARRIADAASEAHAATGYESSDSAGEQIGRALRKLESVREYDEQLDAFFEQLNEIDSLLNDFNRDLSDYMDGLDDEAETFDSVEDRLNTINHLKAKYGRTIKAVLKNADEKRSKLAELADYEALREQLKKKLAAAEKRLTASSAELTKARRRYADTFAEEASAQFAELNFARADFAIEFRQRESFSANGRDEVEFTIATNPGDPRRPLKQVVSGGELSRLMLGIRTMFADTDQTGTIIFDEIDTGISGRTAQKVAEKLARVARKHQVLCITHLPQIAAMADTHYGISKALSDSSAITNIEALNEEESAGELARLLGGAEITRNTLGSAKEMKEMCRKFKKERIH